MHMRAIVLLKEQQIQLANGTAIYPEQELYSSPEISMAESFINTMQMFAAQRGIPFNREAFSIIREFSK